VKHQQSPQYLLNSFSIHNYQHLHSLLPESLLETPLCIADPEAVRRAAVKQMRGKRRAKKAGDNSEMVSLPQDEDDARPAFDRATKKQLKAASRKPMKPTSAATQRPAKAAS
jgi:hypothetical protein